MTFVDQIFLEKEVENVKKEFLTVNEFSVHAALRLFDLRGRGQVSLSEFQDVATELLSPCTNPYLLNS